MTDKNTDTHTSFKMPDPVMLGQALMDAYEKAQPLFESYMEKYAGTNGMDNFAAINFDPLNIRDSYLEFIDRITQDPSKLFEIQSEYAQDWMNLWQESMKKFMGEPFQEIAKPDKGDKRFKAVEWQESALFDFIKQSYLLTCRHMEKTIDDVDGLDEAQRKKLRFQNKLYTEALSPTNFFLTNPEVLNETVKTGGENLVKGFENLLNDLGRGHGDLNITTTNHDAFELGKNIAVTEGQVVYQNGLIQLIQYEAKTDKVHKTPLLIVPPWINKYYILDLRSGNSLIEWAVEQGHTVFAVSWVNPSSDLAQKQFEDYMSEGILSALDHIEDAAGEAQTNVVGYCLGGTLLATTLAYLTKKKQESRIASATFLTTLLDFEHAGDMQLFLDDEQLGHLERLMDQHGVLDGKELQRTFSLMRANDLIWSFVVNNYLMGREPFPFDLLYWNDDCTNMPAAMHRFYLRNMYRDNKLIKAGGIEMKNVPIDLSQIKTPCHFISTKEDHIAPWIATYEGTKIMGGDVRFTLAASGHIAGVVNPPAKNKYCYWDNDTLADTSDAWFENAVQHDGSWWPAWQKWIETYTGEQVLPRKITKGIEKAPGSYVKKRN
ncbi:MAG: class I poly(R)-hydroxyalkanoic acid synthase [Alphaproteobacteria bacterium]